MWGSASVHVAGQGVGFFLSGRSGPAGARVFREYAELALSLKLLWWSADEFSVQRWALIAGLSLAMGGITLAGIGEWATSHVENAAVGGKAVAAMASSNYGRPRVAPLALPEPPDASDRQPGNHAGYTLRRDVPEVRLQFTVDDGRGRLVSNLTSGDIQVFDNQSPVPHFNEFERDDDLPLQLGLLLDTSDSVRRSLPQEKRAAIEFLDQIMRPQMDNAFVIGFAGDYKVWQASTASRTELVDAIDRVKEPGWGTRIFDALYEACSRQAATRNNDRSVHRAILVLTDGDDTDSLHTLNDVIAIAQRSEIQIYPLTIHSRKMFTRGDGILQRLADSTGGELHIAASTKELADIFAEIGRDLRTQYYLSFPAQQATPGYHSLRVEVRNSRKLEVHARQGYYALEQ